ncbi:response regulator receiver domain protein [Peptostreptococcus stomatis DSM 17678]|uniref:Stage 0 sporulation protein A homolog n=1 Tax=Peptostreptococcus stomatis DSM 17678 TaxID=596315 RepID=E0E452_9FIRM|nr:response regulator transcription factor [Peptostreptococcus stomatis]EFM64346.1 response regulator receiver domain protein [Peptostreptococcus stomatis DSM 17678]
MAFKICMIEDDSDLAGLVKEYIERYDFEVSICEDFKNIDKFVDGHGPDLILLDINIPYFDGFYWCNEIRKITRVPIIFTSARTEDYDQVRAIMSGGDDYITKPFSYDLLLAKVNSQLRRAYGEYANKETGSTCGDCSFNKLRFTLKCKNKQIDLPKNEAILIGILFDSYPNVVSREKILSEIWDSEMFVEENTLNVTISRVRKKLKELESDLKVITVRGMGYKVEYEG